MMGKIHGCSLAASQDRLKGKILAQETLGGLGLTGFSPLGPVVDDPVRQRPFKADIVARFLGLDPFVPQNLFPLGLELAIKRRVSQQITTAKGGLCLGGHTRSKNLGVELLTECNTVPPDDNPEFGLGTAT